MPNMLTINWNSRTKIRQNLFFRFLAIVRCTNKIIMILFYIVFIMTLGGNWRNWTLFKKRQRTYSLRMMRLILIWSIIIFDNWWTPNHFQKIYSKNNMGDLKLIFSWGDLDFFNVIFVMDNHVRKISKCEVAYL